MASNLTSVILIIAMSTVTILLRFLPFLIFNKDKKIPKIIIYLGDYLPAAAIAMLVVYCLRDINLFVYPYAVREVIASIVVVLVQIYKRNSVLSILIGSLTYILLVSLI